MLISVGRRKTAIATAILYPQETGTIEINHLPYDQYLQGNPFHLSAISRLFETIGMENIPKIRISVKGGGFSGQAEALHLAISRVLSQGSYRQLLKSKGFLRQDSRRKERKKYGLKKARKAPQFSKR